MYASLSFSIEVTVARCDLRTFSINAAAAFKRSWTENNEKSQVIGNTRQAGIYRYFVFHSFSDDFAP